MTEVYHPNSEADSGDKWPEALQTAQHVHNAMVEAEFQMYVWWYIRRSYGPMLENGNISKRGYMMSHFSKFVRPGYVRVDATKAPVTNVDVSAYKSADSVVIVAINRTTSAVNQKFVINNGTVTKMEGWRTSGNENMVKIADVNVSGSFTANLPAQSVTTFVGNDASANIDVTSSSSVVTVSSSSQGTTQSSSSGTTPVAIKIPLTHFSVRAMSGGALRIEANAQTVVEIFDLKGNKATSLNVSSGLQTVKLSLPSGVYFAKVHGMQNVMFVVR
jgi:glucuronoarabinoxylan endo-1,4-beta-xylanase